MTETTPARPLRRIPADHNPRRLLRFAAPLLAYPTQLGEAFALLDETRVGYAETSMVAAETAVLHRLAAALEHLDRTGRFDRPRIQRARKVLSELAAEHRAALEVLLDPDAADGREPERAA